MRGHLHQVAAEKAAAAAALQRGKWMLKKDKDQLKGLRLDIGTTERLAGYRNMGVSPNK